MLWITWSVLWIYDTRLLKKYSTLKQDIRNSELCCPHVFSTRTTATRSNKDSRSNETFIQKLHETTRLHCTCERIQGNRRDTYIILLWNEELNPPWIMRALINTLYCCRIRFRDNSNHKHQIWPKISVLWSCSGYIFFIFTVHSKQLQLQRLTDTTSVLK